MKAICCMQFIVITLFFSLFTNGYAAENKLAIALFLWRGETVAEQGFKDGLRDLGYEVEYTVFNAAQEKGNLAKILHSDVQFNKYDYVYTFGTTATAMVKQALADAVPHVFNIVADPVGAKIVAAVDATGGNICGVSNDIPLSLQIKKARDIFAFNRLGVVFNPREKNSEIISNNLVALGKELNFEVERIRTAPTREILEQTLMKIRDKSINVDAIYFPTDSFLVSEAEIIGRQLKEGKIVSIGAIKKYIDKGVMLGMVTDYYTLGKLAAGIIDKHQNGKKLQEIPVQFQENPTFVVNATTADTLGIHIDEMVLKDAVIVK